MEERRRRLSKSAQGENYVLNFIAELGLEEGGQYALKKEVSFARLMVNDEVVGFRTLQPGTSVVFGGMDGGVPLTFSIEVEGETLQVSWFELQKFSPEVSE